jgi:hypothetical protein
MYADEAGRFNVLSAGSHPKGAVNPFALKVLESYGYQATGFRSMSWEDFGAPGPPGWISCSRFATARPVKDARSGRGNQDAHWDIEDSAASREPKGSGHLAFGAELRDIGRGPAKASCCRLTIFPGVSRPKPSAQLCWFRLWSDREWQTP